ncbi:MAG: hypothetical protein H6Q90_3307 [Deltaproteobacteria bacterium]|nr:hypothetical protein [Deltaproteobacteria bacterium]
MNKLVVVAVTILAQHRLATADCVEEAASLRAHLTHEAHRLRVWNTAWAVGFGVAATGQLTLALTETKPLGTFDRNYEESMYVGAATATIGMASNLVLPVRVRVPGAIADACADVTALRGVLATAARDERRTFWLTVLGGTALNAAGGLLLWHRRDFTTGALSFLTAMPIVAIQAWTEPRGSLHAWTERRATWTVAVAGRSLWLAREF